MSPVRLERLEAGIRIVLEFNEAFNRHDLAGMIQLLSDDCVFESANPAPDGTAHIGKESLTQYLQEFFQKSPQAHIEIEDIFGLGMRCIMRWRYEWSGETGTKGHLRGVDIFQLKEGFICERLSYVKG